MIYRIKNEDVIASPHCHESIELNIKTRLILSGLYLVDTFSGMLIMLLFMTYNGWVFLVIVLGLALGYFTFKSGVEVNLTRKKVNNESIGVINDYQLSFS